MNKKLFLGMFAAAGMLLATSCSNDELDVVQSGNEAQVTFSLAAEGGIATRAISDGKSADLLYYAIFDADQKLITTIATSENGLLKKENAFPNQSKKDEVTVTLAKGQEYTAVFWAQDTDCKAYKVTAETDGLKVAVDYEGNNNDETRDAFFKAETFKVTGNAKIDVELKRPFAQINVGVTDADWNAAVASGITISESKVIIKNAATSINLLDGTVSGEQAVEYDFAAIPTDPAILEVDVNHNGTIDKDEKYKYLSMSYILTDNNADKTTLEADGLQFTFKSGGADIIFDEGLHAVPVQRNWRTNIIGKLLTGDIQFNIVIDDRFDGDYIINNGQESTNEIASGVTVEGNTYYISSAAGLKWVSDQTNSTTPTYNVKNVVLVNDVDMTDIDWKAINLSGGTFDGGNHTISNLTVNGTEKGVGLFNSINSGMTVKNVKVANVNMTGSDYVGAIVGQGVCAKIENCHVDGVSITANVLNQDGGAKVGGIAGRVVAEGGPAWIKNCSVKNVTVKGYRDVGGIAGMAQGAACTVENVSVDNVAVIADMLQEYKTDEEANAGKVVGRNSGATVSGETTNNVTVTIYGIDDNGAATVGTADAMVYAINEGATTINLIPGTYTIPTAAAGKTLTISGTKDTKISVTSGLSYANGATVTFEGVTIQSDPEEAGYTNGFADFKYATFNNCVVAGTLGLDFSCEFNNCEFDIEGDFYSVWTWGAGTATFKGCTFNCDGKALLVYPNVLDNGTSHHTVNITDCVFNDNGDDTITGKAAIEITDTYPDNNLTFEVNITNTTVNGFSVTTQNATTYGGTNLGTNVWGNKNLLTADDLDVIIDGTEVY